MKNARNVNVLSYCSATEYWKRIEDNLSARMAELGYSDSEILQILSQVSLASICGMGIKEGKYKVTSMLFNDINDMRIVPSDLANGEPFYQN